MVRLPNRREALVLVLIGLVILAVAFVKYILPLPE
jgi:hypothetical protein